MADAHWSIGKYDEAIANNREWAEQAEVAGDVAEARRLLRRVAELEERRERRRASIRRRNEAAWERRQRDRFRSVAAGDGYEVRMLRAARERLAAERERVAYWEGRVAAIERALDE